MSNKFPKLDIVMLDNWLRGCAVPLPSGRDATFPDGKEFFSRMLCGARIQIETAAAMQATKNAQ